jgi:CubicO group peptidase (beta-lactamase class C family)
VEAGKLALESRVPDYLGLTNTRLPAELTLYHLLTMTGGIADWIDEEGDPEENWATLARTHPIYLLRQNRDYLPFFVDKEPLSAVGERYRYSNAGYILLGLMIEQASGENYFDYIREHIFRPAGMTRSDYLALDGVDEEVAEGYCAVKEGENVVVGWKKNIYLTTPDAAADGGATSTVEDLSRFFQALRANLFLSPSMTQAMLTPHVRQDEVNFRGYTWMYGYANIILLDQTGQIVRYGHTGEEEGISCRLIHYPQVQLDLIILGNQSGCAGRLAWEIHDLIGEARSHSL